MAHKAFVRPPRVVVVPSTSSISIEYPRAGAGRKFETLAHLAASQLDLIRDLATHHEAGHEQGGHEQQVSHHAQEEDIGRQSEEEALKEADRTIVGQLHSEQLAELTRDAQKFHMQV